MFLSRSQDLEIFFLPAVPTEHLDGHRQPHFPMTLHSVPPRLAYFFSATWAIWCSFRREFQAKLDFEMLSTLGIEIINYK